MPSEKICQRCNRSIRDVERVGSLTSFLINDLSCNCESGDGNIKSTGGRGLQGNTGGRASTGNKAKQSQDEVICLKCGKVIPSVERVGSMTAFFFKDMRCKCPKPQKQSHANLNTRFAKAGLAAEREGLKQRTVLQTRTAISARDAMAFTELAPGQTIGGCYQLMALAGQGGMGSVYQARHTVLGRECAIKFLAPSVVSQQTWQLFQKEAKLISSLSHHTICQIYDLGIHSGALPYYAMDYVDGKTLEDIVTQQGPLSVGAAVELYLKVLEGLAYAHRRGIVHKDLKPANIMLQRDHSGDVQVKILDFGISELNDKNSKAKQAEKSGQPEVAGSAAYMSPEQFRGRDIDERSDIYNIGCSLFETLTGTPPFLGGTFADYQNAHLDSPSPTLATRTGIDFPAALESVIAKCLEKSPHRRYQNAGELSVDLGRILENKPLQFASNDDSASAMEPQSNSRSVVLIMAAGVTLVLLIGAGAAMVIAGLNTQSNVQIKSTFLDENKAVQTISKGLTDEIKTGKVSPVVSPETITALNRVENNFNAAQEPSNTGGHVVDQSFSIEEGILDHGEYKGRVFPIKVDSPATNLAHWQIYNPWSTRVTTPAPDSPHQIQMGVGEGLIYKANNLSDLEIAVKAVPPAIIHGVDLSAAKDQIGILSKLKRLSVAPLYLKLRLDENTPRMLTLVHGIPELKDLRVEALEKGNYPLLLPDNLEKLSARYHNNDSLKLCIMTSGTSLDKLGSLTMSGCRLTKDDLSFIDEFTHGEAILENCTMTENPFVMFGQSKNLKKALLTASSIDPTWLTPANLSTMTKNTEYHLVKAEEMDQHTLAELRKAVQASGKSEQIIFDPPAKKTGNAEQSSEIDNYTESLLKNLTTK